MGDSMKVPVSYSDLDGRFAQAMAEAQLLSARLRELSRTAQSNQQYSRRLRGETKDIIELGGVIVAALRAAGCIAILLEPSSDTALPQ
jgi:hypothetical protein